MTFHHNDYRIDQLVNQRQQEIRRTMRQSHQPTRLRVRAGMALIALGERLRGRTPMVTTPRPAPRLHGKPGVLA